MSLILCAQCMIDKTPRDLTLHFLISASLCVSVKKNGMMDVCFNQAQRVNPTSVGFIYASVYKPRALIIKGQLNIDFIVHSTVYRSTRINENHREFMPLFCGIFILVF